MVDLVMTPIIPRLPSHPVSLWNGHSELEVARNFEDGSAATIIESFIRN